MKENTQDAVITFRTTQRKKEELKEKAAKQEMTVSDYLNQKLENDKERKVRVSRQELAHLNDMLTLAHRIVAGDNVEECAKELEEELNEHVMSKSSK